MLCWHHLGQQHHTSHTGCLHLLVDTMFAVAAMFALTSGSTIMFMAALMVAPECPVASDSVCCKLQLYPPLCCQLLKLNVLLIVCPVSPDELSQPQPLCLNLLHQSSKCTVVWLKRQNWHLEVSLCCL